MKILMFSTHSMKYIWYSPQKSKYPLFIQHSSFNNFATIIFARNLEIHWFKPRRHMVANNCRICIFSISWETHRVILMICIHILILFWLWFFLYMRASSWDFNIFHARTLSKGSDQPAHLHGSLVGAFATIVNAAWLSCFCSELPSIRCENEKIQTHSSGDWAFFSFSFC